MITLKQIESIETDIFLDDLKKSQLTDIQRGLCCLCYPVGVIDGLFGPRTRNSWAEFKEEIGEGNPSVVSMSSLEVLGERVAALNEALEVAQENDEQVKDAIEATCQLMGIGLKTQIAYVLATTQWETAHTFKPVKEAFWLSEGWRKARLRYYPYYGRGYVQLTWKRNYDQYGAILGKDLAHKPETALEPATALFVLVHGFKTGTFTGRRLEDYVSLDRTDFRGARLCINGYDKWRDIKELAEDHLEAL